MTEQRVDLARRLLPLIDLTSLNDARDDDVAGLCAKARTPFGTVAAVCSWPAFAAEMARHMAGTGVTVAAVVNFPHGGNDTSSAVHEARSAVAAGAWELDLVWPYRDWLAGQRLVAMSMVAAVKEATPRAKLKVILETGALPSPAAVAEASADAIAGGADVLKTSTGKIAQGASPEAARAMLEAIHASGRNVGFKASGGIRTLSGAAAYLTLAEEVMGPDWVTADTVRIGASRLLDEVLSALQQGTG